MPRGRPRHPDILTPREWQVLALLREGLTNEEIAERLRISESGARYHVSEILSKLGVSSRREAAAWQPEREEHRGFAALGLFAGALKKASAAGGAKLAGGAVLATAAGGLVLLAAGVLSMQGRQPAPVAAGAISLAYVDAGAVWAKELPDGAARKLADLPDSGSSVIEWSPSGDWLLVNGLLISADGHTRREAEGCMSWSPVADELVCSHDDGTIIETATGDFVATLDPPASDVPVWSPDGQMLAYPVHQRLSNNADGSVRLDSSLWTINRDGSQPREVFNTRGTELHDAQIVLQGWSADMSALRFWTSPSFSASAQSDGLPFFTVPLAGGAPRQLAESVMLQPSFVYGEIPDGRLLLTAGSWRETWQNKRIALLDPADGSLTYLTPPDEAAFSPVLSPDATRIAYVSGPDIGMVGGGEEARIGAGQRRIWVMNTDGSGRRQLTNDPAYRDERPIWSADGSGILFARLDAEGQASLWLVPASGGSPARVAAIGRDPGTGVRARDVPRWFGFYGYINWDSLFDWSGHPQPGLDGGQ